MARRRRHAQFIAEERHGGGSGCNFALGIKRLDSSMPVETITIVGDDEGGRFLRSLAEEAGIGHTQMHVTRRRLHTMDRRLRLQGLRAAHSYLQSRCFAML